MAVQAVYLSADAFLVCLTHVLTTEKEEVIRLCVGQLNEDTHSKSRLVHTGTEMCGIAENVDAFRTVHI